MLYLSGAWTPALAGVHPRLGALAQPNMGTVSVPSGMPWAADNGCFTRPETFTMERYLDWLDAMVAKNGSEALWATAPDVVGDGAATLARAFTGGTVAAVRRRGHRAALVAQDGMERLAVPWDEFDALFVGGSTAWKEAGAWGLIATAKERGVWVHVGRVNSWRRLEMFWRAGVDSVDGTMLAFRPDKYLPQVVGWLERTAEPPPARSWQAGMFTS